MREIHDISTWGKPIMLGDGDDAPELVTIPKGATLMPHMPAQVHVTHDYTAKYWNVPTVLAIAAMVLSLVSLLATFLHW